MTTYREKLKDPRWQRKRLEVLSAADFCCEICGDGKNTLHVHHRQYFKDRDPWDYEAGQLSALCEECHESLHEEEDRLLKAASFIGYCGPIDRDVVADVLIGLMSDAETRLEPSQGFEAYFLGRVLAAFLKHAGEFRRIPGLVEVFADSPDVAARVMFLALRQEVQAQVQRIIQEALNGGGQDHA